MKISSTVRGLEETAAIIAVQKRCVRPFCLTCRSVASGEGSRFVSMVFETGCVRTWREKRQDYRERLWKEIGEEEETRERKSLFYFILFRLESLVALIGPGVHRLRPN